MAAAAAAGESEGITGGASHIDGRDAPSGLREHIKRHTDKMVAPPEVQFSDQQGQSSYPAVYSDIDARDRKAQIIKSMMNSRGTTPFGQAMMPEWVPEWMETKEAQAEEAVFENWYTKLFDMRDPWQRQMSQKLLPEYWERREELLRGKFKLIERAALINLRGPQDRDDLIFLYGVKTGKIQLPTNEFWLPNKSDQAQTLADFQAGLFSLFQGTYPEHTIGGVKKLGAGGMLGSAVAGATDDTFFISGPNTLGYRTDGGEGEMPRGRHVGLSGARGIAGF